ncbi:MAG: lysoplasmalogenase [Chitinophagaceae bacterium]
MNVNRALFIGLITVAAIVDIYLGQQHSSARLFSKPFLMPIIMGYYVISTGISSVFSRLFLAALFFSWLGDIFLLFENKNGIYFILGLSAFLTAHVLYIIYFSKTQSETISFFRKRPVMFLAIVAYVVELLYLLWPQLGPMKLPVLIYALVIGSMLVMALWQYGKLPRTTALLFIIGAMLFVLSDSALALNRFYKPHPYSGILVMATYVGAQVFLTLGSITHLRLLKENTSHLQTDALTAGNA